jgi:large subunit ribosomal protein L23
MSAFWDKVKKNKEKEKDEKSPKAFMTEDRKKREDDEKASVTKTVKNKDDKKEKKLRKKPKKKKRVLSGQEAKIASKVLVDPKVSEAAMNMQALGKYVFNVYTGATKQEISQAVEAFYGVQVVKVNTINYNARSKSFRGIAGSGKAVKKAVVTLKEGQSLDIFQEAK